MNTEIEKPQFNKECVEFADDVFGGTVPMVLSLAASDPNMPKQQLITIAYLSGVSIAFNVLVHLKLLELSAETKSKIQSLLYGKH
jgi:hypothetical protein